jgi:hypothetical protein
MPVDADITGEACMHVMCTHLDERRVQLANARRTCVHDLLLLHDVLPSVMRMFGAGVGARGTDRGEVAGDVACLCSDEHQPEVIHDCRRCPEQNVAGTRVIQRIRVL